MTTDAVAAVYAERVFDAVADRVTLAAFHVPFERLVPGSRVESHVADAIVNRGRVALVGRTGSGNSSLSAWVCSPARGLADLRAFAHPEGEPEVVAPAATASGPPSMSWLRSPPRTYSRC